MHTKPSLRQRLDVFQAIIRSTYLELFLFWILVNVAFAALYFIIGVTHPAHGPNLPPGISMGERIFDSFYFSVMTATSTGYGDIVPLGFSKMLAMVECTTALLIFAVFVGKLVSEGAEAARKQK